MKELKDLTREEYITLLKSGMFWEFYPEATGVFREDIKSKNIKLCVCTPTEPKDNEK